jgi:magnesium chelatase family protein
LEVLRGPLEDGEVTISRVNLSLTYPAKFMLVASLNPCPCGYYGSTEKECTCTPWTIAKYLGKISGPLLDRIDIHIEVKPVRYEKLNSIEKGEDSRTIKERVNKARQIQKERYSRYGIYSNSELMPELIDKYCKLSNECRCVMEKAFMNLGLSARAHARILKVSRTIADLEGKENIEVKHVAEAIGYRSLDRKYGDKF